MNKINKLFVLAAGIFVLASCNRIPEYKTAPFARLADDDTAYEVNEDTVSFRIPVTAYNAEGLSGNVTFEVKDGTAKAGTNYTIEPAGGVLSFNGNGTQYITVKVVNLKGEFTGSLGFSINVTGATGDLTLSGPRSATVTIKDLDHPLAAILGTWVATKWDGYWGDNYAGKALTIEADPDDVTKVFVKNLDPYTPSLGVVTLPVVGQVNEEKNQIVIEAGQPLTEDERLEGFFYISFNDPNPDAADNFDDIVINIDGKDMVIPNSWGTLDKDGNAMEIMYGGATFVKK